MLNERQRGMFACLTAHTFFFLSQSFPSIFSTLLEKKIKWKKTLLSTVEASDRREEGVFHVRRQLWVERRKANTEIHFAIQTGGILAMVLNVLGHLLP